MNIEINFAVAVAITIGLTELVKKMEIIPVKFMAVISLVIGLAIGIAYIASGDLKTGIWQGLGIGLSASGLFSGVKNLTEAKEGI